MSYMTLHGFDKNGDIFNIKDYKNAHLYHMLIWLKMGEKYGIDNPISMMMNEDKSKEIWGLSKDKRVSLCDRITMTSTFDKVLVNEKDFGRLVNALKESAKWLPSNCHISELATDIENLKDVPAIGWNGTSVVRIWDSGEWKDEDEYVPYNLNKHTGHFDLFEDLEGEGG